MSGTYTDLLFHVVYSTKYRKPLKTTPASVLAKRAKLWWWFNAAAAL
jgi:hypothetical protein